MNNRIYSATLIIFGIVIGLVIALAMRDVSGERTCDGVYAEKVWGWSTERRCIPLEVWNP